MEQKWHFDYLNARRQATNKWLFTEIMGSIISNNKHIQEHPGRLTDSLQTDKRPNTSIQLLAVDYSRSSNNSPLSPWACIRCSPKPGWWWKLPLYHHENPELKLFFFSPHSFLPNKSKRWDYLHRVWFGVASFQWYADIFPVVLQGDQEHLLTLKEKHKIPAKLCFCLVRFGIFHPLSVF